MYECMYACMHAFTSGMYIYYRMSTRRPPPFFQGHLFLDRLCFFLLFWICLPTSSLPARIRPVRLREVEASSHLAATGFRRSWSRIATSRIASARGKREGRWAWRKRQGRWLGNWRNWNGIPDGGVKGNQGNSTKCFEVILEGSLFGGLKRTTF